VSLHKTKDQLVKLLGQTDNNVIALSGKWGTCSLNRVRQRVGDIADGGADRAERRIDFMRHPCDQLP